MAEKYFAAARSANRLAGEGTLFEMANLFKEDGMLPKAAAVLERLTEEFGESRRLPSVYMELGASLPGDGGLEIAISNYYMVLNSSLNISIDQVERAQVTCP